MRIGHVGSRLRRPRIAAEFRLRDKFACRPMPTLGDNFGEGRSRLAIVLKEVWDQMDAEQKP